MKQSLVFDQLSCRLQVEGLPDVSVGQNGTALGIITGWSLQWLGRPLLEGRREHLQALMQVVLPYARHLISGVRREFSVPGEPVDIGPHPEGGHRLLLRSSQPDTPPLEVRLDDAELADLVRVLDLLRLDPRLQLPLAVPDPVPLGPRELLERTRCTGVWRPPWEGLRPWPSRPPWCCCCRRRGSHRRPPPRHRPARRLPRRPGPERPPPGRPRVDFSPAPVTLGTALHTPPDMPWA